MVRTFSIHGKTYSLCEYGLFMLNKTYRESEGYTQNPAEMSKSEIEEWALELLEDRMLEDEEVYEMKS